MLSADCLIATAALGWAIPREIVLRRRLRRQVNASLTLLARASRLIGEASIKRMKLADDFEAARTEVGRLRTQNAALRVQCGAPPELMSDDVGTPL